MEETKVAIVLQAIDEATATLRKVSSELDNTNSGIKNVGETSKNTGLGFGSMTAAVAAGQFVFQEASQAFDELKGAMEGVISTTEDLGQATFKVQQQTGMTAQDASALIAVFDRFGVDTQGVTKDLGLFAKQIEA